METNGGGAKIELAPDSVFSRYATVKISRNIGYSNGYLMKSQFRSNLQT